MAKGRKMKTRKAAVKRFETTKTGKLERHHSNTTHLGRKDDSSSRSRKKRKMQIFGTFKKKILKMIKG